MVYKCGTCLSPALLRFPVTLALQGLLFLSQRCTAPPQMFLYLNWSFLVQDYASIRLHASIPLPPPSAPDLITMCPNFMFSKLLIIFHHCLCHFL